MEVGKNLNFQGVKGLSQDRKRSPDEAKRNPGYGAH